VSPRPRWRRLVSCTIAAGVLATASRGALSAQSARSSADTAIRVVPTPTPSPRADEVQGELLFIWGDPRVGGEPAYQVHVHDARGTTRAFVVDAHDAALVAQLQRVSGQRVTLAVDVPAAAASDAFTTSPLPRVRAVRAVASMRGDDAMASSRLPQLTTRRPFAVVLCKFQDVASEPSTPSEVLQMYTATRGGAIDFFRELGRTRLDLTGTSVTPWVSMPRARSAYAPGGVADLTLLANDCLGAADSLVDYAQFGGVAMHFNSSVGCCLWGGSTPVSFDGPTRRMPAVWLMNWARIGAIWHEIGHTFGLPHSSGPYFQVYDSKWDAMSDPSSGVLFEGILGRGAAHFLAWQKHRLGLLPDTSRVEVAGAMWHGLVSPHASGDGPGAQLVMVPLPNAANGALLTIEARRRVGYDVALPGEGVLLAHVDPARREPAQVLDVDGNGDVNDRGAIWRVGQRYVNATWGVTVAVDSQTTAGWWVTVQRSAGVAVAPRFDRADGSHGLATVNDVQRDSVRVLAPGPWRVATHALPEWLRVERAAGSGDGWVVYRVLGSGLPPGRARTTLRFDVVSSQPRSSFVIEAGVLAAPGDGAYLSRTSRRVRIAAGEFWSPFDSVSVRLSGTWANASWSLVTSSRYRLESGGTQLAGSGPRTVRLNVASGLAPVGSSVIDTLRVAVQGPSSVTLLMIDTIVIEPAVARWAVSARAANATVPVGVRRVDSVQVSNPSGGSWSAFSLRPETRILRREGVAGDWMLFSRQGTEAGTVVDTVFFVVSANPAGELAPRVVDSITWVDVPLRVTTSRALGTTTVTRGQQARFDSVLVQVHGTAGIGQRWRAGSSSPRLRLHTNDDNLPPATGLPGQALRWSRVLSDMPPGRYIDTITVTVDGAANSPLHLVDTTVIVAPPAMRGDVDADGAITAADGLLVLRWLVQLPLPVGVDVARTGDANCDGQVTVADALLLLQLETGLPLGSTCVGRPIAP
jgi:M6 family metalloprotease-like protein